MNTFKYRVGNAGMIYKFAEATMELKGVIDVRKRVFVDEQGIAEDLVFSRDENSDELNVIAKDGDTVVGTARVVFPDRGTAKIERMAVLSEYRQKGIGKGIMDFLDGELTGRTIKQIVLHAQYDVLDFYKACGFKESGPPFFEAGIKHIKMEKPS